MPHDVLTEGMKADSCRCQREDSVTGSLAKRISLTIDGLPRTAACPVSFGVPLAKGQVSSADKCAWIRHSDGTRLPAQVQRLAHWSDGSVRWMLMDAIFPPNSPNGKWFVEIEGSQQVCATGSRISVKDHGAEVVVDTGMAAFHLNHNSTQLLKSAQFSNRETIRFQSFRFNLLDRKGRKQPVKFNRWEIETAGPVRTTLASEAIVQKLHGLRVECRLSFFASTGLIKSEVRLHNPQRARHPGGIWDLGDRGSLFFEDFSLEIVPEPQAEPVSVLYSVDGGSSIFKSPELTIYQDSSGGDNWNSQNHVNAEGRVPCKIRGYMVNSDGEVSSGLRAEPVLDWELASGRIGLGIPEFWQQFPKTVAATEKSLRVGLFPHEWDSLHELQGGEKKAHSFWLHFRGLDSDPLSHSWVHHPVRIHLDAEECDRTSTLPWVSFAKSDSLSRFDAYLAESIETLESNRERVDEYGWRNYGDIFADHEQTYYTGTEPLVSHYNNQFDMIQGFLVNYLRTGDYRLWELGDALARHVADIDIYDTTNDKPAYNGGLFWFTDHYLHAKTSTHRTYSEGNRPSGQDYGGGPCASHNFTTGLLLHYYLSGNPASREAVLKLSDWVIAMDDGRRTILGIADDSKTGLASGGGSNYPPSRAGGNSINALVDAWQLSNDRKYLNYGELLIRRCVHPKEDVAAHHLLDIERCWSYTVFLASLAKYIEAKQDADEFDSMWVYARDSLLNYAKWMLHHERPYFDQVETMEFPTEAWVAQEFRKANVLRCAAEYAQEPFHRQFLKRGNELADRAWSDLLRFETRTHARALAIVMTEGLIDCSFRLQPSQPATAIPNSAPCEEPTRFIPQRQNVFDMLRTPQGLCRLVGRIMNPLRWLRYYRIRQRNGCI